MIDHEVVLGVLAADGLGVNGAHNRQITYRAIPGRGVRIGKDTSARDIASGISARRI
jgi:hypothetical protein